MTRPSAELMSECPLLCAFVLGRDGEVLDANSSACAMLGVSREQLVGHPLWDFFPPTVAALRRAIVAQVVNEGSVVRYEDSLLGDRCFDVTLVPVRDEAGAVASICLFAYDISQQKANENRLWEECSVARVLLSNPLDVALLLDTDGVIVTLNERALASLEGSREDVVGRSLWQFLPQDTVQRRKANLNHVLRRGKPCTFETPAWGRSWLMSMSPVVNTQGLVERVALVARDITELKRRERELEEKNQALQEKNLALHNLMSLIDIGKDEAREAVVASWEKNVKPALRVLRRRVREIPGLVQQLRPHIEALERALDDVSSEFFRDPRLLHWRLTNAEQRICYFIGLGIPVAEIANNMGISVNTTKVHIKHIRKKLGIAGKRISISDHLFGTFQSPEPAGI